MQLNNIILAQDIKKFFKGDIDTTPETLEKYSHDASVLVVKPLIVLFPKDSKDIQNLVRFINSNINTYPNLSITPRAAGTCMAGGAIGESIILDFTKYMNAITSIENVEPFELLPKYPNAHLVEISGVAQVAPGCFYRDFEDATLQKDLLLPCYTASKSLNAIGGMVGNNSAGEKTLNYGKTEDYIKELQVVFADGYEYTVRPLNKKELYLKIAQNDFEGDIYKNIFALINENKDTIKNAKPNVSKNSAGYYLWNVWDEEREIFDLTKLIVGSQGTLGIVTNVTLHLVKVKKESRLVVVFMRDLSRLGELVDAILPFNPESIESYDDATMKLAIRFFPDFLKKKGIWGMIKFMWSFWPEAFMMLVRGMPKLILLVEFAGNDEKVIKNDAKKLAQALKPFNFPTRITQNKSDAEKYWDIRRESFALLRKHIKDKHTAPFIDDIVVRPEFLPEFLPKLNKILKEYPITYTIAGHAGNGNFHIIPLMDFSNDDTAKIIIELSKKVYNLVLDYKGSTTAEHNDGIIRTPFLRQMYGEKVYNLFEQTKKIFDSKNILNPGKKVGGSIEYTTAHILKEKHTKNHKI
jgi:FAD/FMN-containing dehydrogenase